jgi:hypothetical protein
MMISVSEKAFQTKIADKLTQWEAMIRELEQQLPAAEASRCATHSLQIEKLQAKQRVAERRLQELQGREL